MADEILASCGDTTRFRRSERENVVPYDWNTKVDSEVAANYWLHESYSAGWVEHYQRFRGDSYAGASHRYTGFFFF